MAKPVFSIEKDKSGVLLQVKGELSVQHAREAKRIFQQASDEAADVHLQLLDVTSFDISAVQLTYLLRAEVQRQGHQFKITLPQDASLLDVIEKCGITKII